MPHSYYVSAIVPAHNEEKYVLDVIRPLIECEMVNEVICVDDGSTDQTSKKVSATKGALLVRLNENKGKSCAVAEGIYASKGDIILLIDADIVGLTDAHVHELIEPLQTNRYVGVIGYPSNDKLVDIIFKSLTGERAYFKKDLLPQLKHLEKKGYGLEIFLNHLYRNKKVKIVPLKHLRHIVKYEKYSYEKATVLFVSEGFEIFFEILKKYNLVPKSYFLPLYKVSPSHIRQTLSRSYEYVKRNVVKTFKTTV